MIDLVDLEAGPRGSYSRNTTPEMNSWKFSCESKGSIPLPPASTFPEAFSKLNPDSNSFFTLESPDGNSIQCRGSKERCTIELHQVNKQSETHYVLGRPHGSDRLTTVTMSNGGVEVHENEVFQYWDAIELFMRFYAGKELSDGLTFREAQPAQPSHELSSHADHPQNSSNPARNANQTEPSEGEFKYANSAEELFSMILKFFFPKLANFARPSRSFTSLHNEFGGAWSGLYEGLSLCLSVFAIILWGYLLQGLEVLHSLRFDDVVFDNSAKGAIWYGLSLPIGLATGAFLAGVLMRCFLKKKYRDFVSYHCLRLEIDIEDAGRIFFTGCVAFGIALIGFLHNFFTVITHDELIFNRFFSFSTERVQFSDIESITTDRR